MANAKRKTSESGNTPGRKYSRDTNKVADWISVDPLILQRVIASLSRDGGAVRFGYTRDGGAYSIGVYGDGDPYTVYIGPHEDVDGELAQLATAFE